MVRIPVSSLFQPSAARSRSRLYAVSCSLPALFLVLTPLTSPAFEDNDDDSDEHAADENDAKSCVERIS